MVAVYDRDRRRWAAVLLRLVMLSLLLCSGRSLCAAEKVHFSDFDDPAAVSNEWSLTTTATWPADDGTNGRPAKKKPRRFLGEFTNDTVALSLKSLPKHAFARISFDLLILKNWDGVGPSLDGWQVGPQYWGLQVDDGPLLLHAAFANGPIGLRNDNRRQTFPTLLPGERVPLRTRAWNNNLLGYDRENGGDAVYKLKFLIPHTSGTIKFNFFGDNVQAIEDQSWGLDNVTVEVLTADEVPPLDEKDRKAAWDDLGEIDPVRAYDAGWKLIADPQATTDHAGQFLASVGFLPGKLQLAQKVQALAKQLDANEFRARERAMKELYRLGSPAVPYLRRAWKSPASAEAKSRLELLLSRIEEVDPATLDEDTRRRERISVILGIINTPAAKKLLEKYYPER